MVYMIIRIITLPKLNKQFAPEELPKPYRKVSSLPVPPYFRGENVKLPGCNSYQVIQFVTKLYPQTLEFNQTLKGSLKSLSQKGHDRRIAR